MTETQTLQWIKTNLGSIIHLALQNSKPIPFTSSILAGMAMRETGIKIMKNHDKTFQQVCELMKGDYGQRRGELVESYHGFGFWQIDIGSYPEFVKSGDWKDPYKCCLKAIKVLEEKRTYIASMINPISEPDLIRASIAGYNCGQGNTVKAIKLGMDVDRYTFNKDYSREVLRFAENYSLLS